MLNGYLRQSTASQSRTLGPFIDDTDFKTVETGLTIANTDVKLVKNGAASVNKNSGGGTHRINGKYSFTFNATDTNTVGEMDVSILVSGALLVTGKFVVLEEAVYDALFDSGAIGYLQPTVGGRTLGVAADGAVETVEQVENTQIIGSGAISNLSYQVGAIDNNAIAAGAITPAEATVDVGEWGGSAGAVKTGTSSGLPQTDPHAWQGATIPGVNMIENDAGNGRWTAQALEQAPSGGGGLTEQQVRDAMKLAPSAGAPAAGSVDEHLDNIEADTAEIGTAGAGLTEAGGTGDQFTGIASVGAVSGAVGSVTAPVTVGTNQDKTGYEVNMNQNVPEGYSADGGAVSLSQILHEINQNAAEFLIAGQTLTVRRRDGSTTAMTFTLDDDTNPTSRTRST